MKSIKAITVIQTDKGFFVVPTQRPLSITFGPGVEFCKDLGTSGYSTGDLTDYLRDWSRTPDTTEE